MDGMHVADNHDFIRVTGARENNLKDIIDLGPSAGHDGGRIGFEGTPVGSDRPGQDPHRPTFSRVRGSAIGLEARLRDWRWLDARSLVCRPPLRRRHRHVAVPVATGLAYLQLE